MVGLIVTMSGDRKSGYIIKADQPLGDRASQLCVYKRMANIRLFDARKPGVNPAVLLKAPDADAVRHCEEFEKAEKAAKGTCLGANPLLVLRSRGVNQGVNREATTNGILGQRRRAAPGDNVSDR